MASPGWGSLTWLLCLPLTGYVTLSKLSDLFPHLQSGSLGGQLPRFLLVLIMVVSE